MTINNTQYNDIRPGDGFLEAVNAPAPLKPFIVNTSRLEHGDRITMQTPRKASRNLTLQFNITGATKEGYDIAYETFLTELYKGSVNIVVTEIPALANKTLRLIYMNNSPAYARGLSGRSGKVSVSFIEPNPDNE